MSTNLALDDDLTVMAPTSRVAPVSYLACVGNNALTVGTRLGEFEIQGLIAEGGFGIVYAAYDRSLQRTVALKEYMPSTLATRVSRYTVAPKSQRHSETFNVGLSSFINEARLLARFDHPSLVKVYRFWEANGTAYMVMPLYEGVTLKEALRSATNPPDEAWLKALIAQLLEALGVLHAEHCYHRDIAPDNILILRDGRPLLLDFGAARRVIEDMTQALTVILKPGYAPIEQYSETSSLRQGAWTDLYALAALVHLAITGTPPIASPARMVADPHERLAERAKKRYSPAFLSAIDRALEVLPEARPQSVAEFAELLGLELGADAAKDPGITASTATNLDRFKSRKKTPAIFAMAGAALAAMIGSWYGLKENGEAPPSTPKAKVEPSRSTPAPAPGNVQSFPTVSAPVRPPDPAPLPRPDSPPAASEPPTPASRAGGSSATSPRLRPAPVTPTPVQQARSRTPPRRNSAERAGATVAAEPTISSRHSSTEVSDQSHTSQDGVTRKRCSAILARVSLGETLTAADQQFIRENCR